MDLKIFKIKKYRKKHIKGLFVERAANNEKGLLKNGVFYANSYF